MFYNSYTKFYSTIIWRNKNKNISIYLEDKSVVVLNNIDKLNNNEYTELFENSNENTEVFEYSFVERTQLNEKDVVVAKVKDVPLL